MKRLLLMLMCALLVIGVSGCNKEKEPEKEETAETEKKEQETVIDYDAIAKSMTYYVDPLKPAFGDESRKAELEFSTYCEGCDIGDDMYVLYNSNSMSLHYDTMFDDGFFYELFAGRTEQGDSYVQLQQQEHKGYYNDVIDKTFLFGKDGKVKLGYWIESGQGADPGLDMMTWTDGPLIPGSLKTDGFIKMIGLMKDSKYGSRFEEIICTDILIKDIQMLEGLVPVDGAPIADEAPMPSEGTSVASDPYGYFKIKDSTNLDKQKGIRIYMEDGKTMKDGSEVSFEGKPLGYLQVKEDRIIRIRDSYGTDAKVIGHIYDYAIMPYYEVKESGGYSWYRIDLKDMWVADDGTWLTIVN